MIDNFGLKDEGKTGSLQGMGSISDTEAFVIFEKTLEKTQFNIEKILSNVEKLTVGSMRQSPKPP